MCFLYAFGMRGFCLKPKALAGTIFSKADPPQGLVLDHGDLDTCLC